MLGLLGSLPVFLTAQTDPEPASDPDLAATMAENSIPQPSARELVEGARDDFLNRTGLTLGTKNPKDAYVGWGMASVSVDPSNPAWARARGMAYQNAMMDARANFIKFQFNSIMTESTRTLFEDSSYNLPQEPAADPQETQSALKRAFNKLVALGDAKLNQELVKMGIDPKEFDDKPQKVREDLFSQRLIQRTVERSFGSLAGLITLQTFEGNDDKGYHNIGVLVVYSESFRQFAREMYEGRGAIRTEKARRPIKEQIPTDPEILSRQFGVRRLYDENGMPVFVSYGQWSVISRGASERSLERSRENALRIARSNADSELALFVNGNLTLSNDTATGEIIEEYLLKEQDPNAVVETVENVGFLSVMQEEIRQRAEVNISGLTDFTTFTYNHPDYQQEIIGVVRTWSIASNNAATKLRTGIDPEPEEESKVEYGDAKVKESGPTVDVSDF